ncbi:MAG: DUF4253 domain-containing protein [Nitrospirota bacterium]
MAGRYVVLCVVLALLGLSCTPEKRIDAPRKSSPVVVLTARPQELSQEQRTELGFPPHIIAQVEAAAAAHAEPFFETVLMPSQNLKGDVMIMRERLAGFSVRTRKAEKLFASLADTLRPQGYLIFRSEQNYGSVPDLVTVIRGASEYDILTMQKTEARNYKLTTTAIIRWLKAQRKRASFVITGAGQDWVEARFTKPPKDMYDFALRVYSFAPDVVHQGAGTVGKLAAQMKKANGFYLWWD